MGPRLMLARPWVYGLFNGVVGGLFIGSVLGVEQALLQPDQYSWGDAAIVGLALGVFSATVWGLPAGRRQ